MKPYTKTPISVEDQAVLLQSRGLVGDFSQLVHILHSVNYYRFTGFLFPYREQNSEKFREGTSVEKIWAIYSFDRRLRALLFECISRIEIAMRTRISHEHACATNDPFCYVDKRNFDIGESDNKLKKHAGMLKRIHSAIENKATSRAHVPNSPINHYRATYSNENVPIWMAFEMIEFGVLPVYFELLPREIRMTIAGEFGVTDKTFLHWLTMIKNLRNSCAHHERLVFSRIPTKGIKRYCDASKNRLLTNLETALQDEDDTNSISLYAVCCILVHMLKLIRPESRWHHRFKKFILDEPSKQGRSVLHGFSSDKWIQCNLWH